MTKFEEREDGKTLYSSGLLWQVLERLGMNSTAGVNTTWTS